MYVLLLKPTSILLHLSSKHSADYSFVNAPQTKTFDLLSVTRISIAESFFLFGAVIISLCQAAAGTAGATPGCLWALSTWPYRALLPDGVGRASLFCLGFQFYIPHRSGSIWFLTLSLWLISLSILFSRSIHVISKDCISSSVMLKWNGK